MHIWEVFCTLLVYGSAIFYDPRQMESWMQYVINLNPIYWYITAVRSCVMWGEGLTPNMVLIPFLCAALSLGLGIWVFKRIRTSSSCTCKGASKWQSRNPSSPSTMFRCASTSPRKSTKA